MPSEYDEQLDSTDTQLPGEYDLFDLMAQVTEENLHPLWILGHLSAVKRYSFFAYPRTCNTSVLHLISLFSCDYRWL
jgi:hypothetical protein